MFCIGASSRYRPSDIPEEEFNDVQCLTTNGQMRGSPSHQNQSSPVRRAPSSSSFDPKTQQKDAMNQAKMLLERQGGDRSARTEEGPIPDDVTVVPSACAVTVRNLCGQT
mmetsp:Transcript_29716/g.60718  ORF Transcript_29716/g.60718 Transcript_29716/m.60718 type:complete len:110 (-) Transcript_29716:391-720(-)